MDQLDPIRARINAARSLQQEINAAGMGDPRDKQIDALRAENDRLVRAEGEFLAEIRRLRAAVERGKALVEEMDTRMPEQATEDADGFIVSYRIPVGPWHRLLGWARSA